MSASFPDHAAVVIIGGGFAGASTACFLARAGVHDLVVIEAEDQPGVHASGLNAAIARQLTGDPVLTDLLRRSVSSLARSDWLSPVAFRASGSLLLFGNSAGDSILRDAEQAAADGLEIGRIGRDEAVARVPWIDSAVFDTALFAATDGVVDIHALLWRFLSEATGRGGRLLCGCRVEAVEVEAGRVVGVRTGLGRIEAPLVVDAAGAWANTVAASAGLSPLPLTPFRRHLVVTPPLPGVDPGWPVVWSAGPDYYFRPETGGLLLSPCDQTQAEPGNAPRDPAILDVLADRLAAFAPRLAGIPVKRFWAGLRTLSRDGRFVIGPDPRLDGFFWVAGLGGHGMTGSVAIGEIAAASILGSALDLRFREAISPARFLPG